MTNTMKEFTAAQWLLINLASHYDNGLDKAIFEDRLAFGRELLELLKLATTFEEYVQILEPWTLQAGTPEEFAACAIAIWDTLQGDESNYSVGLDACNSGAQIMSCLGRCVTGMENTGLINTGVRPDLYQTILDNITGFTTNRKTVKKATVPHLYGSKREPKNVFGEERYPDFIAACKKTMPVVEWAKDVLIACWDSEAMYHEILLPNAGVVHMKVIDKTCYVGKFQGFNYNFYVEENKPKEFGQEGTTCLAANVVHPMDGYILSELDARCNHDPVKLNYAISCIDAHLASGSTGVCDELVTLNILTNKFNLASIVAVEHIALGALGNCDDAYLLRIKALCQAVLKNEPFELKCIH